MQKIIQSTGTVPHTPTPWHLGCRSSALSEHSPAGWCVSVDNKRIANIPAASEVGESEQAANAEHIVLCVNSHDALVKALTDAAALMATAAHFVHNESVRTTNKFDRTQTVEVHGLRDTLKAAADEARATLAAQTK